MDKGGFPLEIWLRNEECTDSKDYQTKKQITKRN